MPLGSWKSTRGRCLECGKELKPEKVDYDAPRQRLYCATCKPVVDLKESWQPMYGGARILGVYRLERAVAADKPSAQPQTTSPTSKPPVERKQ